MRGSVKRFSITLALSLGAIAWAAAASAQSPATYYACARSNGDIVANSITSNAIPRCNGGTTLVSWDEQGPIGPVGPQGATGLQGPAGSQGPQGLQGEAGAGANAIATTFDFNAFVNITPPGTRVVVKSLSLPAGAYFVTATLDALVDRNGFCELVLATSPTVLDQHLVSSQLLPNFVPQQEVDSAIPVTLQAAIDLPTANTVNLQCVTFSTPTYSTQALQIRRFRLTALTLGTVTSAP